jgi:hypothetical protein
MNLAEALPEQQKRVRQLIPMYESIGPASAFAVACMCESLSQAERAASSGDVIAMLRAYEDLKGYKE